MRIAARAIYRGRQFFGALRPHVDETALEEAFRLLSEPERRLFQTMTVRDQQHCLDVYRRLRQQGHEDADLLVAALLHDVGKGRIALWHRVVYVVLKAWAPGLLRRLAASGDGPGRAASSGLYRCLHHPELGAKLAQEAGSSDQVVALIREAENDTHSERAAALRAADETV